MEEWKNGRGMLVLEQRLRRLEEEWKNGRGEGGRMEGWNVGWKGGRVEIRNPGIQESTV